MLAARDASTALGTMPVKMMLSLRALSSMFAPGIKRFSMACTGAKSRSTLASKISTWRPLSSKKKAFGLPDLGADQIDPPIGANDRIQVLRIGDVHIAHLDREFDHHRFVKADGDGAARRQDGRRRNVQHRAVQIFRRLSIRHLRRRRHHRDRQQQGGDDRQQCHGEPNGRAHQVFFDRIECRSHVLVHPICARWHAVTKQFDCGSPRITEAVVRLLGAGHRVGVGRASAAPARSRPWPAQGPRFQIGVRSARASRFCRWQPFCRPWSRCSAQSPERGYCAAPYR